jgi:hypothetical protein
MDTPFETLITADNARRWADANEKYLFLIDLLEDIGQERRWRELEDRLADLAGVA